MNSSAPVISVQCIGKCFSGNADYKSTLREKIYRAFGWSKKNTIPSLPFWALRNVSFEVEKGDVIGIIGANGAGKSTLLKLLAQIIEPTEGRMEFRGKVVSILEIGTGFHPDLTGIENIYLSGSLLQMSKAEIDRKLNDIIVFSELGDFLHRQVKYYSSGMFLRLAFSVCSHLDAEILLLDEIVSVGDAAFASKSLQRIREMAVKGKTIILASHDLGSVQHICSKCILMEKGQLVEIGETGALVERYIEQGVFKSLHNQRNDLSGRNDAAKSSTSYLTQEIQFPTTQNDEAQTIVRLRRAKVSAPEGSRGKISMVDSVQVEFEFEKLDDTNLNATVLMSYNTQSTFLSADLLNSEATSGNLLNGKGIFSATCRFPPLFFNHGIFSVDIYFTDTAGTVILAQESALSFKVEHDKLSSGELKYEGKFHGPLYPKLNWQIEKI